MTGWILGKVTPLFYPVAVMVCKIWTGIGAVTSLNARISGVREWFANNYTWVFSGAGVAIVASLVGLLRWKRKHESGSALAVSNTGSTLVASPMAGRDVIQTVHITGTTQSSAIDSEFSGTPTANEIRNQISALPIYQQLHARQSYDGLKIKWPAKLTNLHHMDSGRVGLSMRYGDEDWGATLYTELELARYPRLKTIYGGEPVVVTGTIAEVQSGIIWLDVRQLDFR